MPDAPQYLDMQKKPVKLGDMVTWGMGVRGLVCTLYLYESIPVADVRVIDETGTVTDKQTRGTSRLRVVDIPIDAREYYENLDNHLFNVTGMDSVFS